MTASNLMIKVVAILLISIPMAAYGGRRMTSPADNMRFFEAAERIAQAMERDSASFFNEWPVDRVVRPNRIKGLKQLSVDGGQFNIGSRIRAERSQIALTPNGTEIARVTIKIQGDCVSRKAVKERYPKYFIAHIPHGQSLDEVLTYATKLGNTQLEFAFPERNRECLSDLILTRPTKEQLDTAIGSQH